MREHAIFFLGCAFQSAVIAFMLWRNPQQKVLTWAVTAVFFLIAAGMSFFV